MKRFIIPSLWFPLPFLASVALAAKGLGISPFLVALILILFLFSLTRTRAFLRRGASAGRPSEDRAPQTPFSDEEVRSLAHALQPLFAVKGWKAVGPVLQFEGSLRCSPSAALQDINGAIASHKLRAFLTEGERDLVRLTLVPVGREGSTAKAPNWWVHALLFLLTLATTTWAGALHQGVNLLEEPGWFVVGLPYSIGLLLILGAHELGHYFAARRHGIQVTPPYFVPAPFALGTFGAFIRMRGPAPDRRALFDMAVAGPFAGLAVAIPALLFGLGRSQIMITEAGPAWTHAGVEIGSSVLMALLAKLALGPAASAGRLLSLHPLAFAGWLGLLVTALNLLPIGQLDGGHIAHALWGLRRSHTISRMALFALFVLALLVWPALTTWALIVFFLAGSRDAPATDDVTPLDPVRQALGYFAFVLLALILIPVPQGLYESPF